MIIPYEAAVSDLLRKFKPDWWRHYWNCWG